MRLRVEVTFYSKAPSYATLIHLTNQSPDGPLGIVVYDDGVIEAVTLAQMKVVLLPSYED